MHKGIRTAITLATAALTLAAHAEGASLVERLGFKPDARLLIVNADDYGMNHATNEATEHALASGGVTSTTIMVPCPWYPMAVDFAKKHPTGNFGVHTVLTSEWSKYKWGPVIGVTAAPSLVDDMGYFHPDVPPLYLHAKIEDVNVEIRAQIDKAIKSGLDITHIDSHMGAMQYAPGYHKLYIEIAKEYNLPCRIAGRAMMEKFGGGQLIDYADQLGVLHCEELITDGPKETSDEATAAYWKEQMANIPVGKVTEILIHCGKMTPEMEATTASAKRRTADTDFFANPETVKWIKEQGIELISYRELRELQRTGKPIPRVERYGW